MAQLITRRATQADALAITRIYNQGIEERIATFETIPRTVQDIEERLAAPYPLVVAERDGHVAAWAGASQYRPRACYAGIAEFSVYTDCSARRKGAGRAALAELLRVCEHQGYWKLVSRIFPENLASRSLCAALGFREVGVYRRHAQLDGVWRDVVIVEKLLGGAASTEC